MQPHPHAARLRRETRPLSKRDAQDALRGGIHRCQQNKAFGHVMDQCGQCCHPRRRDIRIGDTRS